MDVAVLEKEISGFIGRLLRENFGRGPGNVFCSVASPFVSIYVTNFLSPMEKTLMGSQQSVYVQKTRDLMMETLEQEIRAYIETNTEDQVKEFYYDWNLDAKTGVLLFILESKEQTALSQYRNKAEVEKEIIDLSIKIQKKPEQIQSGLLNERTLIVVRKGTLISLEKEFIQLGFQETLKVVKKKLEKRMIDEHRLEIESQLDSKILDFFVDWDFKRDKSYILFVLKPN
ncbi:Na-translocating system protein MpsC family protein [Bacillus sp. REN3]|uniref:DUF2294 domain-containing protein n=1 Tax=Bacillus sp. REN3 TaxID=2802440 RepID=UPI001AEE291B|nr:Na-translocating system protein MpsC family protein [Bacillus sp. REN3]